LVRIPTAPTGDADAVWSFSKFKKEDDFDQRMPFQRLPWISSFFHTVFNTKSVLSLRDHSHTVWLAKAQINRMLGQFLKNLSFMLHQSGKNNKLGSVKNSRDCIRTLQADFSKGFDIGFSKGVSDDLQKVLSKRKNNGIKEKGDITLARFLNRNRTNEPTHSSISRQWFTHKFWFNFKYIGVK
jgi:hypothetical protein